MNTGFYITSKGDKVILELSDHISVTSKDLIELFIPDGIIEINCGDNQLTRLILPDSVEYIYCWNNNLTELIIPDNCKVNCDHNVKLITRTMFNRSKRLKQILK
jgi:hypothetical protein